MEVFFLAPGTFLLILPWIIIGVIVLCAVVYFGIKLWLDVDDRREAKARKSGTWMP